MAQLIADVPVHIRHDRTLRAKIIDACGMTCTFCHNEGTAVTVDQAPGSTTFLGTPGRSGRSSIYAATNGVSFLAAPMQADDAYENALTVLRDVLGFNELHLTGGEPSLHLGAPALVQIAHILGYIVAMTSNGENGKRVFPACAKAGLSRVNFSIFGTTPKELAQVQQAKFQNTRRAEGKIAALRESIRICSDLGVAMSANLVVPALDHRDRVVRLLEEYSDALSIRLLNSLDEGERSVMAILRILDELGAVPVARHLTAGASGSRTEYRLPGGRTVHFKEIRAVRLPDTCRSCRFNNGMDCQEGFYGVRLYRDITGRYLVGVCIQRMDLTLPLEEFVAGDLPREILRLRQDDHDALTAAEL